MMTIFEEWQRIKDKPTHRPALAMFADMMEHVLHQNDDKGGWAECSLLWLQAKLMEEAGELAALLVEMYHSHGGLRHPRGLTAQERAEIRINQAARECVDIANVAMMIADLLSGRPQTPPLHTPETAMAGRTAESSETADGTPSIMRFTPLDLDLID